MKKQLENVLESFPFFYFTKEKYKIDCEKETRKLFNNYLTQDFKKIIYAKTFDFFTPNWDDLKTKHKNPDNIYNTYIKMTKIFKTIKNKSKIEENIKRKLIFFFIINISNFFNIIKIILI